MFVDSQITYLNILIIPIIENTCICNKILIVDDNAFNILALETLLKSLGYKCDTAFDGETGVERVKIKFSLQC